MENDFIISKEDAEKLIDDYINQVIKNPKIKVPRLIGGTVSSSSVSDMRIAWNTMKLGLERNDGPFTLQRFRGLTAWSCWEQGSDELKSKFFLTFEINPSLNLKFPNTEAPAWPKLTLPVELVEYQDDAHEAKHVLDYVTDPDKFGEEIKIVSGDSSEEPNTVLEKLASFVENGPSDENGPLNEFYFGLFDNRNSPEVDRFIDQEDDGMEYIRYYFGYDGSKKENKIRVILLGLDKNGDKLFPDERNKNSGFIMLQNSWPPKTNP